jgi:hypothetical protein
LAPPSLVTTTTVTLPEPKYFRYIVAEVFPLFCPSAHARLMRRSTESIFPWTVAAQLLARGPFPTKNYNNLLTFANCLFLAIIRIHDNIIIVTQHIKLTLIKIATNY